VLGLEDATLLGAVVEVLGHNYLMALLGFQAVLVTAEKDVKIVGKKAEEIVGKKAKQIDLKVVAKKGKKSQELLVPIAYLFGTVQCHKDSCL